MPDASSQKKSLTKADMLNAQGVQHHLQDQNAQIARMYYLAALNNDPDHPEALQNLGAALVAMGKFEAAASVSRRAIARTTNNINAKMNLAVALVAMRRYQEAIEIYDREGSTMLQLAPMLHNYGLAHHEMGDFNTALSLYDKSVAIDPAVIPVQCDRSLALLAVGEVATGLKNYEIRWKTLWRSNIWDLNIREWKGESLEGKRLLVHHEQGLGDSLMLCRFLSWLIPMGADITVAVPEPLVRVIANSFPQVKVVAMDLYSKEPSPLNSDDYDLHSPFLSVMRWLNVGINDIEATPYLWSIDVPPIKMPTAPMKIGLCWASGDHGPALDKRRRHINLVDFLPLTEIPGVKLVSLQKDRFCDEIIQLGMEGIIFDCMTRVEDFAMTADLINQLDLVVSVDSAVIHLAGAMGKPSIMLSPFTRCWRWWGMDGTYGGTINSGLPWYENMTTLRQDQDGEWKTAVRSTINHVQQLMKGRQ